ncbi:MAG: type IV toxin-antitoxin system AbiEi family antitoxin [Candidatus Micrarchaeota archaeon]
MGPFEYALLARLERDGVRRFAFGDAVQAFPDAGRQVLRNTLSKLARKGRLHRIRRGEYLLVPLKEEDYALHELALAAQFYPDGYVSFLSALAFHGLTTQLPTVVQVAVRKPARKHVFLNVKYEPVRVAERFYGGFKTISFGGGKVKMALKEKAILDCLLRPDECGGVGAACKALRESFAELDWSTIDYFLKKMSNSAVERRLYYCIAFLGKKNPLVLPPKKFVGYRKLDSSKPARGKYDSRYGLRINVDLKEELG